MNLAEIEDFFRDEELEVETQDQAIRGLTRQEINELPASFYQLGGIKTKGEPQTSCRICIDDFSTVDLVRGLRCLHIFHVSCIDSWLIKTAVCPICRVIQYKKELVYTARQRRNRNILLER